MLVAGRNFGCGSSREHAPWALQDYGFRAVIAPSFADIFYNNCFKNGILPVVLPEATVNELLARAKERPGYSLTVDLEEQTVEDEEGVAGALRGRRLPPGLLAAGPGRHRPHHAARSATSPRSSSAAPSLLPVAAAAAEPAR